MCDDYPYPMRPSILFSYATLYIVWGSTYWFIKVAVASMPPFWLVALRFLVGGLGFLGVAWLTGRMKGGLTRRQLLVSGGLGIFLLVGGNGLVTLAETTVDSYLAALVIASTPLAVALFDRLLVKIRIRPVCLVGIIIGMAGVGLLLYNGSSIFESLTPGVLLVICGLASWAFATSLGHRAGAVPDLVVNSGVQMLTAGLVTGIATLVFGPAPASVIPTIDPEAWLSLAYLAVCGSLAFAAYTHLIHNEPAIRVVSYAFVNPLIAMVFGLVISNETATPYLVPGALMILGGLALMLWGERLFGVRADPPAGE